MPEYDLQDPTDVDILRGQFDMLTADEWQEYIELAEEKNKNYKTINILKTAQRKAGIGKYLSPKVLNWIMSVVEELDTDDDDDDDYED